MTYQSTTLTKWQTRFFIDCETLDNRTAMALYNENSMRPASRIDTITNRFSRQDRI